jgi:hypothetical protein
MKSERRHELHTNQLAKWLGHQIEVIRPYTKAIIAVVLAVVAIWVAITLLTGQQASRVQAGWSAYYDAFHQRDSSAALAKVARDYSGTKAGLWALQSQADAQLEEGTRELFRDRKTAEAELNKARENYQRVEREAGRDAMLRRRAVYGLGQVHESLGNLNEAREKYEQLAKEAADTAIGKAATRRLAHFVDPETGKLRPNVVKFVDQFASYTPPATPAADPHGFRPGAVPGLDQLPDFPDQSFTTPAPTTPPSEPPQPAGSPTDTPPDDVEPDGTLIEPATADPAPGSAPPEPTEPDEGAPDDTLPPDATLPETSEEPAAAQPAVND